jgi:hypothetical protein
MMRATPAEVPSHTVLHRPPRRSAQPCALLGYAEDIRGREAARSRELAAPGHPANAPAANHSDEMTLVHPAVTKPDSKNGSEPATPRPAGWPGHRGPSLAIVRTFSFTVLSLLFQFLIGFSLALLFNLRFPLRRFARSLILVPWLLPLLVMGRSSSSCSSSRPARSTRSFSTCT